jgi:hypothetical protein
MLGSLERLIPFHPAVAHTRGPALERINEAVEAA